MVRSLKSDLECQIAPAPRHLSPTEGASFGFTGLTFLSSLGAFAGGYAAFGAPILSCRNMNKFSNSKVLIIGATGGLGSLATKILQANCAKVDGVGSNQKWLDDLELNRTFDYNMSSYRDTLEVDAYDYIFDCADGKR